MILADLNYLEKIPNTFDLVGGTLTRPQYNSNRFSRGSLQYSHSFEPSYPKVEFYPKVEGVETNSNATATAVVIQEEGAITAKAYASASTLPY